MNNFNIGQPSSLPAGRPSELTMSILLRIVTNKLGWLLLSWLPLWASAQNKPDLIVEAPFSVPGAVQAGETYSMSAVIKNQGPNGSQFNCIGYYLSADNVWDATDAYLGAACQSLLMSGQSGTCAITGTIPPLTPAGNYYLVLVADPPNAEREADEANNVVSFAVAVTARTSELPDLVAVAAFPLVCGGSGGRQHGLLHVYL